MVMKPRESCDGPECTDRYPTQSDPAHQHVVAPARRRPTRRTTPRLTYEDYRPDTDFDTSPPPYFDDGAAGSLILFAANTSALASGTGATAGGTEGSLSWCSGGRGAGLDQRRARRRRHRDWR